MDHRVVDNPSAQRYEIYDGDELAGFVEYHLHGNEIAFLHTEVTSRYQGKGLAGDLTHQVLDDNRQRGRAVLPYCPYTRGWITKHPDYVDLVPEAYRARFNL
jgi:hypothetical protein